VSHALTERERERCCALPRDNTMAQPLCVCVCRLGGRCAGCRVPLLLLLSEQAVAHASGGGRPPKHGAVLEGGIRGPKRKGNRVHVQVWHRDHGRPVKRQPAYAIQG
jgi:hypothetical protein